MQNRTLGSIAAAALCLAVALLVGAPAQAKHHKKDEGAQKHEKIKVGIVTGQNNHAWMMDSPALKYVLDQAGLFETTMVIAPDRRAKNKAELWKKFEPKFSTYDVLVLNYNGDMWPDRIKKEFVAYIKGGGKAFAFHAGNNPHRGWTEFEEMIGLLWRGNKAGKRVYFDDQGNKQVMEAGKGPGAGHGAKHAYVVKTLDTEHPVFKGLPAQWLHAKDELYQGQRGPAKNMTVLMTAYNDPKAAGKRATGVHEPVVWTVPYGKGTVMTNVMGHWMGKDGTAVKCAGFQTIFTRSLEWLATGKVTQDKPKDFPSKDKVSLRELKFEPLAYIHVDGVPGSDPLANCGCGQQHNPYEHTLFARFDVLFDTLPKRETATR